MATGLLQNFNNIYTCDPVKWFQTQPYGFQFKDRNGLANMTMFLPISPNNLNITTHFATNIVTTLYGVVEEHSEIRYYDIVISGTTGYAPKYTAPSGTLAAGTLATTSIDPKLFVASELDPKGGRSTFVNQSVIAPQWTQGFMQQTVSAINNAASTVKNLFDNPNSAGYSTNASGYVAFHNLYRLFHAYKKDTAGSNGLAAIVPTMPRKTHPLQFLNHKDGNMYDCVPRVFTLTRSAESPMLYNYQIVLRAYNLRPINAGVPTTLNKLNELGLGDIKGSYFAKSKNLASTAKGIIGGLKSGLSAFGR